MATPINVVTRFKTPKKAVAPPSHHQMTLAGATFLLPKTISSTFLFPLGAMFTPQFALSWCVFFNFYLTFFAKLEKNGIFF